MLFPDKYLLSLSSSKNPTGGSSTARTVSKQKELTTLAREAALAGDPSLLAWFYNYDDELGASVPGTQDEYNPFARLYQQTHKPAGFSDPYRSNYTPEEGLREAKINDGYAQYSEVKNQIGFELAQQGLAPGSYEFQDRFDQQVGIAVDVLAKQNPEWGDDLGNRDEGKLLRREMFFKKALMDESFGFMNDKRLSSATVQSMLRYLGARDAIRNEIWRRNRMGMDIRNSDSKAGIDLAVALARTRAELSQGSPDFALWADRWFSNDVVGIDNATGDLNTGQLYEEAS